MPTSVKVSLNNTNNLYNANNTYINSPTNKNSSIKIQIKHAKTDRINTDDLKLKTLDENEGRTDRSITEDHGDQESDNISINNDNGILFYISY